MRIILNDEKSSRREWLTILQSVIVFRFSGTNSTAWRSTVWRSAILKQLAEGRPDGWRSTFGIVATAYIAKSWSFQTRLKRFVNHRRTVNAIGGVLDCPPDAVVDLIRLNSIDTRYRIALDRAAWFRKEGQLVFSLWDDIDRIFSIVCCLSEENGQLICYIGAIQGRREANSLERYRSFSKAASGMRVRDFLVETFKIFCRTIGVAEIRAVSVSNKPSHRNGDSFDDTMLCYDEIWRDRGGIDDNNGFFVLPVANYQGGDDKRVAKKRANYQKRYAMLDQIEIDMIEALR